MGSSQISAYLTVLDPVHSPDAHCEPFNWIVTGYTDGAQDTH